MSVSPPSPAPTVAPQRGALGPVLFHARVLCSDVACQGFDATAVMARLPEGSRTLLESAGVTTGPHRTILVLRAWLRLTLGDRDASLQSLVPTAAPLVEALHAAIADRQPATELRAPNDADRLRQPGPLDPLRICAAAVADEGDQARLPAGLFGVLGYEFVDRFESLPPRKPEPFGDPDGCFILASDMVIVDHQAGSLQVVTRALPWEQQAELRQRHEQNLELVRHGVDTTPPALAECPPKCAEADVRDADFCGQVADFRQAIGAGEIFQGVLSRGLRMQSNAQPIDVYRALRQTNPSPYTFFLDLGDGQDQLLGASPETFLKVQDGRVEIRPIAGTVARTEDHDLDSRLALSLLMDPKELAEHTMLLDLARNDVARVSEPGSTTVVQQFAIEKFSHVQHLVSRVQGQLRPELDALHAYRAAANMGTLTGAPKVRAMQLIRQAEPHGRGYYGGCAGYLLQDGSFDSCIVIRSLRHRDGVYQTRAGAGVVWDSVPERELEETEAKSMACRKAVAMAETMAESVAKESQR